MKKLSLVLILVPIFLITSLNFYGGENDSNHTLANRAFTCTSCHATIIGEVIISGGKVEINNGYTEIEIDIPSSVNYNGVSVNFSSNGIPEIGGLRPYISDDFGNLYNLDINSNVKGKKENTIKIQYPITDLDREKGSIEIQGVLSNLDGKPGGEYSFYKKIDIQKLQEKMSIYPTISNDIININNINAGDLVKIFNTSGQIVFSQQANSNQEKITVSEFQKGNYFILVQNGKSISQSKFIVSK